MPSMNLARVNDIFEEVTRQMNSLKRQASKAERYAKLREEMRAKLRVVLASKFAQLEQESAALDAQINAISEEMRQQAETRAAIRSRARRAHAARICHRDRSSREPRAPEPDQAGVDRALAQRRHNEERCAELVARAAASEAELAQAQQRLAALGGGTGCQPPDSGLGGRRIWPRRNRNWRRASGRPRRGPGFG